MPVTNHRNPGVKPFPPNVLRIHPGTTTFGFDEPPAARPALGVAAQLRLAASFNPRGAMKGSVQVSVAKLRELAEILEGGAA